MRIPITDVAWDLRERYFPVTPMIEEEEGLSIPKKTYALIFTGGNITHNMVPESLQLPTNFSTT